MTRATKNFKDAVRLAMKGDPLGCDLIHIYQRPGNDQVNAYVTFLTCIYCYQYCHPTYEECLNATRELYHDKYISLSEFRTVLGRLIAMKRKGLI